MLTTKIQTLRLHHAPESLVSPLAREVSSETEEIPLTRVLEVCGLEGAIWSLEASDPRPEAVRVARLLAIDLVDHVLCYWQRVFPRDDRPERALWVVWNFAYSERTLEDLFAASTMVKIAAKKSMKKRLAAEAKEAELRDRFALLREARAESNTRAIQAAKKAWATAHANFWLHWVADTVASAVVAAAEVDPFIAVSEAARLAASVAEHAVRCSDAARAEIVQDPLDTTKFFEAGESAARKAEEEWQAERFLERVR